MMATKHSILGLMCVLLVSLGLLLLVSCSKTNPYTDSDVESDSSKPDILLDKYCEQDTDCVAATCCHATDALARSYGPACTAVLCSMDCQPDTLDCGQGAVKCINNQCTAVLVSE